MAWHSLIHLFANVIHYIWKHQTFSSLYIICLFCLVYYSKFKNSHHSFFSLSCLYVTLRTLNFPHYHYLWISHVWISFNTDDTTLQCKYKKPRMFRNFHFTPITLSSLYDSHGDSCCTCERELGNDIQ